MSGEPTTSNQTRGLWLAVAAHGCWGFFPLFWKQLGHIDSLPLVSHRVVWSFLILCAICVFAGRFRMLMRSIASVKVFSLFFAAAAMIAVNWIAFLYAVNNGRILEASLGYYINPLFNVLLGVLILGERLKPFQWIAVALATVGVGIMAISAGGLPWVSFTMASSFAVYGLIKKLSPLASLDGLTIETAFLFPFAMGCLIFLANRQPEAAGFSDATTITLLVFGGLVTIAPLALFASATRLASLSAIGIIQYVGPTLQWLVGRFVYGEEMPAERLVGFAFVWIGLAVFVGGGIASRRRSIQSRPQRELEPEAEPSGA